MSFHPPDPTKRPQNVTIQYNSADWDPNGGPIQVGYPSWVNPISAWLGRSFHELGLKELRGFTSGVLLGWSWLAVSLDPTTQTRSSSEAFLRSALKETQDLIIYKSTLAKRILFEDRSARSVVVDTGGLAYNLTAKKEVILAAGVVSTTPPI